jgi:hypothetical protein
MVFGSSYTLGIKERLLRLGALFVTPFLSHHQKYCKPLVGRQRKTPLTPGGCEKKYLVIIGAPINGERKGGTQKGRA